MGKGGSEKMQVSVDRLTLVGFQVDYKIHNLLNDITFDLIQKRYRSKYPYDWRYELFGGGVLEIGSLQDQSNIRLDFNPNNIKEGRHLDMIHRLIGCMKYIKPTRIDVAIDIKNIDMNDYAIIDDLSRKTNEWRSGGSRRLETYYIGGASSDLRIRIYDKALEQGKEGKWWRIEAQMRKEFAENYKLFNPFKNITLVDKNTDLSHITNFNQKMTVKHLLEYPEDLGLASDKTRYKYKKILKDLAESNSNKIDFHSIYEEYKSAVNYTLYSYIKHSRINDIV